MKDKNWKTIAIIFIILFVIETTMSILFVNIGNNEINKEESCRVSICNNVPGAFNYWYENDVCYCLNKENEVIQQRLLK